MPIGGFIVAETVTVHGEPGDVACADADATHIVMAMHTRANWEHNIRATPRSDERVNMPPVRVVECATQTPPR
jgi:hypothetical protein